MSSTLADFIRRQLEEIAAEAERHLKHAGGECCQLVANFARDRARHVEDFAADEGVAL